MFLSVFDVFKIGIGPSSSHTMGPMVAARRFMSETVLPLGEVASQVKVSLHGSLAFTGKGHQTDTAIALGLLGQTPETLDPDDVAALLAGLAARRYLRPADRLAIGFDPENDIAFDTKHPLPAHPNGMIFRVFDSHHVQLAERRFYSIGGGFVSAEEDLVSVGATGGRHASTGLPYPFDSASEILEMGEATGLGIAAMMRANEAAANQGVDIETGLDRIVDAMFDCIARGLRVTGFLPGRLRVERRAAALHARLLEGEATNLVQPHRILSWLSVYAMAVNEENASGARVVTAPTNGAAGVVPAVLKYYASQCSDPTRTGRHDFLLTAAAIAGIVKSKASISGAEVGCQGEVGTAAAMAAAGLAAALGASNGRIENAAEIALEHHLGLTCDPVAGLVQIPCIERNALGAGKAVQAASLAMDGTGHHRVSLDACIESMRQTGVDMNDRYKETSLGGLAVNFPVC